MKSSAEVAASAGVEGHDDGAVEPARRQQAQPVALAGELEQRVLRPQELPRMRREGQRRRLAAKRLGARQRGADHRAVAAMHAVEIADRHHGAVERPDVETLIDALRAALRAFKGDVKGCRFAHFQVKFASGSHLAALSGPIRLARG